MSAQDFTMPFPPMRMNRSFDALPESEIQVLCIPETSDEERINSSWSAGRFLRPKLKVTRRKRMFDDVILKMADQGATKLNFSEEFAKDGPEEKTVPSLPSKQDLGYDTILTSSGSS